MHPRDLASRTRHSWLLLALFALPLAVTSASGNAAKQPDKLVILSTTDVKGKTGPCGCHIPKGGLSRRASFTDSMEASYGQVALVDNGGFFAETDSQRDVSGFLMEVMKTLGTVAVGTSEKELRWGVAYLKGLVAKTDLPLVSSNLLDATTGRPVLEPYVIQKIGRLKVGFFSLMSPKVDLGPARDSLKVDDPAAVAVRTVDQLRKQGATVVVLLSQLGKVESEDLAAEVPGIDAVICGRNVPMLQKGRMVKNTVTSYGGEQGHYLSRTLITVDGRGRMTTGENETFMLGPEIRDTPTIARMVKEFEDALNDRLRKAEKDRIEESMSKNAAPK